MSACIPLHAQTPPSGAEREKASALHAAPHLKPHFSRPGSAYVLQMQPLAGVRETKVGRGRRWECMLCVCVHLKLVYLIQAHCQAVWHSCLLLLTALGRLFDRDEMHASLNADGTGIITKACMCIICTCARVSVGFHSKTVPLSWQCALLHVHMCVPCI